MEQLRVLLRSMVDDIAGQMGKSMPLAERKAAEAEVLCAAERTIFQDAATWRLIWMTVSAARSMSRMYST